jgi:hypothetical protein
MYKHYPEELVQTVKRYRRSDYSDEALIADFMKTEQPPVNLDRDYHYERAIKVMTALFKPENQYLPIAFPDLRYYPWTLAVSAEYPYTFSDYWNLYLRDSYARNLIDSIAPTFSNLYDALFTSNRTLTHLIKDRHHAFFQPDGTPKPYGWINLHARSHVVGPDDEDKIRAVFGVPKLLLFIENMFIWPMLKDLLSRDPFQSPMLWGCEIMKGGWNRLRNVILHKSKGKFKSVLSTDWSQFDRRALFSIIDDVHSVWHTFYDWSGTYQPTSFYPNSSTDPERLENLWTWFTYNVKHYPIALPNRELYSWTRNGIASGYQETQLMDSWVNGIMILTCLSEIGVDIECPTFFVKLQGDDSLITFNEDYFHFYGEKFLSLIEIIADRRFNAKLSADKSSFKNSLDRVKVLGYYNLQGIPYRDDLDLLSHLLFPEKLQTRSQTASTCVGLALASMGCSRAFYDTCRDVYEHLTSLEPFVYFGNEMFKKMLYLGGYDVMDFFIEESKDSVPDFPSFDFCYRQSFILEHRDFASSERIWPTLPDSKNGFFFL